MAESDEALVSLQDVLEEDQRLEMTANAVLGAADDSNCTYPLGYMDRQAMYSCATCSNKTRGEGRAAEEQSGFGLAGVCLACSLHCHDGHDLHELYTKRQFRCDCGNSKFPSMTCTLYPEKDAVNSQNSYNHNFCGLYCVCERPYPDSEDEIEDEMIQCSVCEDWFHSRHLGGTPPDGYEEMVCDNCMKQLPFLKVYEIQRPVKMTAEKNKKKKKEKKRGGNGDKGEEQKAKEGEEEKTKKGEDKIDKNEVEGEREGEKVSEKEEEAVHVTGTVSSSCDNDSITFTMSDDITETVSDGMRKIESTPADEGSGDGVGGDGVSGDVVSGDGVGGDVVRGDGVCGDVVSGESVHGDGIGGDGIGGESVGSGDGVGGAGCSGEVCVLVRRRQQLCRVGGMAAMQEKKTTRDRAGYFSSGWRALLCQCRQCLSLYSHHGCQYLLDPSDSITSYEGRARPHPSTHESAMNAFSNSLDRVQQVEAIHQYNDMKTELVGFLQGFAQQGKVVSKRDVEDFFDSMQTRKRRRLEEGEGEGVPPAKCHF